MNAALVLAFAQAALQSLPTLLSMGIEVEAFITQTNTALAAMQAQNRDPNAAEWAALNGQVLSALQVLQAKAAQAEQPIGAAVSGQIG